MYSKNNFFAAEANEANEFFHNATGEWGNAFGSESAEGDYDDADGDYEDADGIEELQMMNAGGARKPAQKAAESQPYIVSVANTTTSNISNVEILNALSRQFNSTTVGIDYKYNVGTMTYPEFLAWISSGNVFSVGQTSLVGIGASPSLCVAQVQETVSIVTKDPNGNAVTRVFNPRLDSFQYSTTQTDLWYDYLLNSFTSFSVGTIYAGTTLKLYFYPKQKLNQFKALKQGGASTKYGNPKTSIYSATKPKAIGK
jgi:hypothetical protein